MRVNGRHTEAQSQHGFMNINQKAIGSYLIDVHSVGILLDISISEHSLNFGIPFLKYSGNIVGLCGKSTFNISKFNDLGKLIQLFYYILCYFLNSVVMIYCRRLQ